MGNKNSNLNDYLKLLKERGEDRRVTKSFQATGLELAQILNDEDHKSLYIKLAKEHNNDFLIRLAKDIAQREGVENKGAYFMKVLQSKKKEQNENPKNQ